MFFLVLLATEAKQQQREQTKLGRQEIRSEQQHQFLPLGDRMKHGRRTAMALACLLCLALLLVQDVRARKLLWTAPEKQSHGPATNNPEPCSGRGGSTGNADQGQQVHCDPSKWAELHMDYIYTQDVKRHP